MLTVLADDLTGAAEIAGIGLRYGLRTALLTEVRERLPEADLLVAATDTRSLAEGEAAAETRRMTRLLRRAGASAWFRKTDSALRGHVEAELEAMLDECGCPSALYLPQNPSKGRIVRAGVYSVGGTPLDRTSFADDPEFPARTASLAERFPNIERWEGGPWPAASERRLRTADAATTADLDRLIAHLPDNVLPAGAADAFEALLRRRGAVARPQPAFAGLGAGRTVILCGSTLSTDLHEQEYVRQRAIAEARMPREVFTGEAAPGRWIDALRTRYAAEGSLILSIGYPAQGGKAFAERLRETMAEAAAGLVAEACPDEMVIEGGATAWAVLRRCGWRRFALTDEIAPGVVRMQSLDAPTRITLKPGSYPWGPLWRG